jgi:hypothetical protein
MNQEAWQQPRTPSLESTAGNVRGRRVCLRTAPGETVCCEASCVDPQRAVRRVCKEQRAVVLIEAVATHHRTPHELRCQERWEVVCNACNTQPSERELCIVQYWQECIPEKYRPRLIASPVITLCHSAPICSAQPPASRPPSVISSGNADELQHIRCLKRMDHCEAYSYHRHFGNQALRYKSPSRKD